eukprot:gene389-422_t
MAHDQQQTTESSNEPSEGPDNIYDAFCRSEWCERIKLFIGTCAVTLLIIVLFVGVALGYSVLEAPPPANFVLLFFGLLLLAYVEALHYACVAVEKWDMSIYAERFPRAMKCQKLVDSPEKVKKFLVGRQFFVIFVVFLISEITTFPSIPDNFAGLPSLLVLILIETGLPGVFLTLTVGQLISQIYVEEFTLQFLNLYGCEFIIHLCLGAEYIGVCNFSWLLYGVVSHFLCYKVRKVRQAMDSGKHKFVELSTPGTTPLNGPMSPTELNRGPDYESGLPTYTNLTIFDYVKYFWSTGVTMGSVVIILYGISIEAYVLPTPMPAAYILLIVLLGILFYLEGLMIAIVATQYWDPETFRDVYPRAYKIHKLVNKPDNVKRFIIGRQFFTVLTNFLLAQITTFKNWKNTGINPVIFFIGVRSGLVGVFVILAFAQLLSELLAAEFPLRFMNLPGAYTVTFLSLLLDSFGVGHCAWTIYFTTRKLFCAGHMDGDNGRASSDSKPTLLKIESAEVLVRTQPSLATSV